jgi:hypothetical protein
MFIGSLFLPHRKHLAYMYRIEHDTTHKGVNETRIPDPLFPPRFPIAFSSSLIASFSPSAQHRDAMPLCSFLLHPDESIPLEFEVVEMAQRYR